MYEELSYQIINISAVNQVAFCCYQKFAKIIIEKKTLVLAVASNITLDLSEFLNIHIFNWCKALYSASSSTFWHLGFIRAVQWFRAASPMVYS